MERKVVLYTKAGRFTKTDLFTEHIAGQEGMGVTFSKKGKKILIEQKCAIIETFITNFEIGTVMRDYYRPTMCHN